MACPKCGRTVTNGDRFCGGCGIELAEACRRCGQPLRAGVSFCTSCGTARAGTEGGGAPTEDRRQVSVLFIDVVDFTPYAEHADPELVRRMQNSFYATVRRVVGQYGGVVEKYIGDAVMALFGAPVATEADALRCVRAGLELQRVLGRPDPALGDGLRFRVGVTTGEALVDVAAARNGGQAIVAGDVVNTAARIQSVAPPGGVLACGRTHALTANAIRYAEQAPVMLRGRSSVTEVWLAVTPLQRQPGDAEPDATPLVEREHELELLAGALHRAIRDRTPQLVTVFGQAGIGKSRLVRELRRRADQPMAWHTGHCPPFGENVTYAGLADIVKAEAGILDTDSAVITRERLRAAVGRVVPGPDANRVADALEPLVGLPGAQLPAEEAESAWRRLLVAIATHSPTVLVFEDLHWADESMLRFIELLAAAAQDVPLLVLGTARPELIDRDASWAGTITGSLTITLPPLRDQGMTALYRHMLGRSVLPAASLASPDRSDTEPPTASLASLDRSDAEPPTASLASLDRSDAAFADELLRPLVDLADGNPLYAQEYVRMLVERGAASARPLGGSPDGHMLPMPDSVHAVIANRVDLLEPVDRAVLQAAAVVGMQFWPGAVAAALGRPAGSVERSLRRLEQREFVSEQLESTMAGQSEFRFRHVLMRDVCYQRLPRTERIARHERTADWLDLLAQHRHTDLAEVLAHHRWAAHEIARTLGLPAQRYAPAARRSLHLAARRAYALHALGAAARHTARALALLGDEAGGAGEPGGVDEPERLRLELLATEISFYQDHGGFLAGGGADQLRTLAERLTACEAPESAPDAARAWTLLGQVARLRADRTAAREFLDRAVTLFEPLPDSAEKVDAYAELGRLHMLNYESEPAIAAAGSAATIAARLGLVEAQASNQVTIATARYESGDPAGLAELREVTQRCRDHRLLALRRATRNLASVVMEEGDYLGSEELLAESRRLDGPGGHNILYGYASETMRAYFHGDFDALAADATGSADTLWVDRRDLRACLRALRDDDQGAIADADAAVADAWGTGFHRQLWPALAAAALCRALLRHCAEATELLAELTGQWGKVAVIPSGEWVTRAAYAAALIGGEPAEALRAPLAELQRHTRWSEAALHTVTGAGALAAGDRAGAGREHLAAAAIHAEIPAVTDQMLALALAAAATRGESAALAQVREFAERNQAPGLLRVAAG